MNNEGRAKLIFTDGTLEDVRPENGRDFTLDELHRLTDSNTVQIIGIGEKLWMIMDDEGKWKDKPLNVIATHLAWDTGRISRDDFIVGTVLLCDKKMIK